MHRKFVLSPKNEVARAASFFVYRIHNRNQNAGGEKKELTPKSKTNHFGGAVQIINKDRVSLRKI